MNKRWIWGVSAVLLATVAIVLAVDHFLWAPDRWLRDADVALRSRRFEDALSLAERTLSVRGDSVDGMIIATQASVELGNLDRAFAMCQQMPEDPSDVRIVRTIRETAQGGHLCR